MLPIKFYLKRLVFLLFQWLAIVLGEYTALVASNSINFFDAIRLVRKRGELMQAAVPMDWFNGSYTWS
jgi:hypothetical protein